jgi:hypothetical protein
VLFFANDMGGTIYNFPLNALPKGHARQQRVDCDACVRLRR